MNMHKGKENYNIVKILLDSECSSTIVMRKLISKRNPKEDDVMQWHNQAGIITTNIKC